MFHQDYTKEVDLPSTENLVPWPYASAILTVVALVAVSAFNILLSGSRREGDAGPVVVVAPAHAPAVSLVSK